MRSERPSVRRTWPRGEALALAIRDLAPPSVLPPTATMRPFLPRARYVYLCYESLLLLLVAPYSCLPLPSSFPLPRRPSARLFCLRVSFAVAPPTAFREPIAKFEPQSFLPGSRGLRQQRGTLLFMPTDYRAVVAALHLLADEIDAHALDVPHTLTDWLTLLLCCS